jgi:hypothetical protein
VSMTGIDPGLRRERGGASWAPLKAKHQLRTCHSGLAESPERAGALDNIEPAMTVLIEDT